MNPMTNEQQQKLISWIEEGLACSEEYGFSGNSLLCMKIALASMTAEPVAKTDVSGRVWMNDGGSSLKPPVSTPLYTAPPVPVIKFPSYRKNRPDGKTDIVGEVERYHFMQEIKKLNGLGE